MSCRSVGVCSEHVVLAENDLDYCVEGKAVYVRRGIYKCNVLAEGLRFCKPREKTRHVFRNDRFIGRDLARRQGWTEGLASLFTMIRALKRFSA